MDEGIVALGEGKVAGLAMQLVTNGYFAQDDVGQRIDEVGRAGEIVVARLDGGFETAIGYTRCRLPEEQDGTTLVECGMCTLLLEEEFGSDETKTTEQVHLVELRIVADIFAIEGRKHRLAICPIDSQCLAAQRHAFGSDAHRKRRLH